MTSYICIYKLLPGVGFGMVVLIGIVAVYYTVIMAWSLFYLAMSFSSTLPWSHCNNPWNTPACFSRLSAALENNTTNATDVFVYSTNFHKNNSIPNSFLNETYNTVGDLLNITTGSPGTSGVLVRRTPTEEFWE